MWQATTSIVMVAAVLTLPSLAVRGQATQPVGSIASSPPSGGAGADRGGVADDQLIALNLPESLEVKVLVDYVAQRLGINILYDEQIAGKRLSLKAPVKVPRESLLGILDSALKMKGLALVDAQPAGWKRIVAAANLQQVAQTQPAGVPPGAGEAVVLTQVFALRHADPSRLDGQIKAFLTQPGANSLPIGEQRLLIVTDYASNLARVASLIQLLDQPRADVVLRFATVEHGEAQVLSGQVAQILAAKLQAQGLAGPTRLVELLPQERTNRIALIGPQEWVEEALTLMRELDVGLKLETRVYPLHNTAPDRVDRLLRELINPWEVKQLYRSSVDQEGGALVVSTTAGIHERIQGMLKDLDLAAASSVASPVRFYKLANTTAAEVLVTIRTLEGDQGFGGVAVEGEGQGPKAENQGESPSPSAPGPASPAPPPGITGPGPVPTITPPNPLARPPEGVNRPPPAPGQPPPEPPPSVYHGKEQPKSNGTPGGTAGSDGLGGSNPLRQTLKTAKATVTADANTNSIIVVAPPEIQRVYERLIRQLDRRRPQVLLECTLVTLDTNRSISVGVEMSGAPRAGDTQVLTFDSFGLSKVNASTGALTLTPGLGFNGVVLSPDIVTVVIRALATSGKAKVISAPKILVNDNATGTLASINEAPFTSVNASNTVATTSFAGYVSAGTTIELTPHISEGDHLLLDYSVALNAFTGAAGTDLPPPRQTNTVKSKVTIPDGFTIVVGGLKRNDQSLTKSGVPILSDIPLLEYLFSNRTISDNESSLFVFLRPIILRDDQFQDLKFLSERDMATAGLPHELPRSQPMLIE